MAGERRSMLDDGSRAPVLTGARTFEAVVIALAAAGAARLGVLVLAQTQVLSEQAAAASAGQSGNWAGLGIAILAAVVGLLLSTVIAIAGVGLGVRGKQGSGRFTLIFAVLLFGTLVVQSLASRSGIGALALPRLGEADLAVVIVGLSLCWALPAAIVGALPWRGAAITAGASVVVAVLQAFVFSPPPGF